MQAAALPILLFVVCVVGLAILLLVLGNIFSPRRSNAVKQMPYESGMNPFHDARRRFNVRFHLLAIAFLVFDVELLFLYPWAVAARPAPAEASTAASAVAAASEPLGIDAAVGETVESRGLVLAGVAVFFALLVVGFVYDLRKGVFRWR